MNETVRGGVLLLLGVVVGCSGAPQVSIVRDGETILERTVSYARTPDERRQGLEGMADLGDDEALVLAFPGESEVCIHNTHVTFAIDVFFVTERPAGGVVTAIETNIPAHDERLRCHRALWAIEVRAILPVNPIWLGDLVEFESCDP